MSLKSGVFSTSDCMSADMFLHSFKDDHPLTGQSKHINNIRVKIFVLPRGQRVDSTLLRRRLCTLLFLVAPADGNKSNIKKRSEFFAPCVALAKNTVTLILPAAFSYFLRCAEAYVEILKT